jgi:adenine C2-methylase RlmN of 23S rRNA A2503 and tRNA A37
MNEKKDNIRNHSLSELQHIFKNLDEKGFRAKQVYEWLWKKNAQSFEDMTDISKELRAHLAEKFDYHMDKSKDNLSKLLEYINDYSHIQHFKKLLNI